MHLYNQKGDPVYQVPYATKAAGMRDTNLSDAKKLNLFPSVTEIIKIMDKPALSVWKENQVLLAALTLPRLKDEAEIDYISRIKKDAKEHANNAAQKGTDIHNAIEAIFLKKPVKKEYLSIAENTKLEINRLFDDIVDWLPEKTFACKLGFGGKIDLRYRNIVIDFKTKEHLESGKNYLYDEHFMQAAAYAKGLGMKLSTTEVYNIFVSYSGEILVQQHLPHQIKRGWQMFRACLNLWQVKTGYKPQWI